MSLVLWCLKCGDTIGTESVLAEISDVFPIGGKEDIPCPGKGKHPCPVRNEQETIPGLVKRITLKYTETAMMSSWYEYVGPKKKCAFSAAMKRLRKQMEWKGVLSILVGNENGSGNWARSDERELFSGEGFDSLAD